jgi:hypothetical protein
MPSPPPTSTGTLMLYLNPESGLPVRFEDIDLIYTYSYDKSPNLRAVVPEDIKNEIVAFEQKNPNSLALPANQKSEIHKTDDPA